VIAQKNASEVAEFAEDSPWGEVVAGETGLRSASDGQAVDDEADDKDDQQDNGSDKSADENQVSGGSQDTLRRCGRAR